MTARGVLAAVAGVVLLTSCGVPTQDTPTLIEPDSVPVRLPDSTSSTVSPSPGASTIAVTVQLVRRDLLVGVRRVVPAEPAARLDATLKALIAGPGESEQARGLSTALPPDVGLVARSVTGGEVTLEITGETGNRSTAESVLVAAQVVLTLTSLPGIDRVRFTRDGQPVEALLADGALTSRPLTAADYASLRSR